MPIITTIAIALGTMALKELGNYAIDSVSEEVFGKEEDKYATQLASLQKGQEEIISRITDCIRKVELANIRAQLQGSIEKINNSFDQLTELTDDKGYADSWSKEVLSPMHGVETSLRNLDRSIQGFNLSESVILTYINTLKSEKAHKQSRHYKAIQFFQDLLAIQLKGFVVYTNAYKYREGRDAEISTIIELFKSAYSEQAAKNKQPINNLSQWYQDSNWENTPLLHILREGNDHYVELSPNCAPDGRVVVGLQLYQKGNRIALKIKHTTPDAFTEVNAGSATWQNSPNSGEQVGVDYIDINANPYAHTEELAIPDGKVVTGAQLYKFGNRVAIRVQAATLKDDRKNVDNASKEWIEPKDFGSTYYEIQGDDHYVHGSEVIPEPLSYITGAGLVKYGNRLAIKIKTSFYTI